MPIFPIRKTGESLRKSLRFELSAALLVASAALLAVTSIGAASERTLNPVSLVKPVELLAPTSRATLDRSLVQTEFRQSVSLEPVTDPSAQSSEETSPSKNPLKSLWGRWKQALRRDDADESEPAATEESSTGMIPPAPAAVPGPIGESQSSALPGDESENGGASPTPLIAPEPEQVTPRTSKPLKAFRFPLIRRILGKP